MANDAAVIGTFKIQGQQSNSTAIATVTVTLYADGTIGFSELNGQPRRLNPSGHLAALMEAIFTGAGGPGTTWFK